jgi:hypothetical protein
MPDSGHINRRDVLWRRASNLSFYLLFGPVLFAPVLVFVQPLRRYWFVAVSALAVGLIVGRITGAHFKAIDERFALEIISEGREGSVFSKSYQLSIYWEPLVGKFDKVLYLSSCEAAIPKADRDEFRQLLIAYFAARGERVELA